MTNNVSRAFAMIGALAMTATVFAMTATLFANPNTATTLGVLA